MRWNPIPLFAGQTNDQAMMILPQLDRQISQVAVLISSLAKEVDRGMKMSTKC